MNKNWCIYEQKYWNLKYKLICGVDEAGRGPLAGPVYAAAVILDKNYIPKLISYGINDSKKINSVKREQIFDLIIKNSIYYNISFANVYEIENINILQATYLAMTRAVLNLKIKPDCCLIDGNSAPNLDLKIENIVKGDSLSVSIAAASILAKVSRDKFMLKMHEIYPEYLFKQHKGYGTKLHIEMLRKYGPCEIHRKSFIKKILKF
ncbi:MAG: ribonuclease HII [Candidatus Improbicoccus devescovinae]|nr:MAG: ribonuclease HII [Candidatus Improbicoccus devescovinae]